MININEQNNFNFFENLLYKSSQSDFNFERMFLPQLEEDIQNRMVWFDRINTSLTSLGLIEDDSKSKSTNNTIYSGSDDFNIRNSTYLECWLQLCDTYNVEIFQPLNLLTYDIKYRTFFGLNKELEKTIKQLEESGKLAGELLNYKLGEEWKEFVPELKKVISSCFLTGGAACKIYMDATLDRPTIKMIEPENFIIDPNTTSLETAETITHLFKLRQSEIEELQDSGIFIRTQLVPDSDGNIQGSAMVSQTREDIDAINSRNSTSSYNKIYGIAETIFMAFPEDMGDEYGMSISNGKKLPYKTQFQLDNGTALMRRRAWYPNLKEIKKKTDIVKFTYNQSMNFWGIGMINTLENLHTNATNVQTLMDSALKFSSVPTTISGSDITYEKGTMQLTAGVNNQINADSSTVPIIKQLEFTSPSPMLSAYLSYLEEKMKTINSLSQIKIETLPANIKGSVLLMLLAGEYKNMSVVMSQMVQSMNEVFEIVKQFLINEMGDRFFINEEFRVRNNEIFNELIVFRSTADPNHSNAAQQMVLYQTLFEYANMNPQLFNMRELYSKMLKTLKVANIDDILLSEEQLQQAQAQQAQAQQAQAQAQAEFQQSQLNLMDKELNIKDKNQTLDHELKQLKLNTDKELSLIKLQTQEIKDQSLLEQQEMIESEKRKDIILNYVLKLKELELKYGVDLNKEMPF